MKTKNIKKLLFVFLVASFFVLVIVPGTMAIFSEKENTKINLNVESPVFTVTFDGNGGTSSETTRDLAYLHEYGELPTAEKCGSTFLGWYTGLTDGIKIESTTTFNIMDEQTLYAKYESSKELYDVLKCEAENTDIAASSKLSRKYTGNHQDSMDESLSTKEIYYYYGSSIADSNYNNVIFSDQCWQIIRTTDTGGVKLLYNGEPEDGQCLDTRDKHPGYSSRSSYGMSTSYYYGTGYTYDKENKKFLLSGDVSTGEIKVGQYTCRLQSAEESCSVLYYVDSFISGTTYKVFPINTSTPYYSIGTIPFNENKRSLSDAGYMYNTFYTFAINKLNTSETLLSSASLSTAYWYADSVTYGTPKANRYNLDEPYQITDTNNYPDLVGKYTFRNQSEDYTNTYVYYIVAVNGSTMYYIQLSNTGNHTLSDFNESYTYGESYRHNDDGTYTINEAQTIYRSDWYTNYGNLNKKYICKNAVDDSCNDLLYGVGNTNTKFVYLNVSKEYKYAKEFEYKLDEEDNTYKYFLKENNAVSVLDASDNNNITKLNKAHYTCFNVSGKCSEIYYVYRIISNSLHYITLSDGKNVDDAINEMLYDDDVNTVDSVIKSVIDTWFKNNIYSYSDLLEDTIFCNDRSKQVSAEYNGWFPNFGKMTIIFKFRNATSLTDLNCINELDKFSTLNDKARLTYKVGLMTNPESKLLNYSYLNKTKSLWLLSPYGLDQDAAHMNCFSCAGSYVSSSNNARPVVSLIPGIKFESGDGSMTTPYIIKTSGY